MNGQKWDDTPLYSRQPNIEKEEVKPKPQFWSGVNTKTSASPSPLLSWYETENRKRQQKVRNEIDINEIKVALKGTINRWTDLVCHNRKIFEDLISDKQIEWNDLYNEK